MVCPIILETPFFVYNDRLMKQAGLFTTQDLE